MKSPKSPVSVQGMDTHGESTPVKLAWRDEIAVADALGRCFNESGDCCVVVPAWSEPHSNEEGADGSSTESPSDMGFGRESAGAATEFKVWSPLLSAHSEVFRAMFSHDCLERNERRIEICEFPTVAVEAFLRFMYSGEIQLEPDSSEVIVDVAAMADKYAVEALQQLCLAALERVLDNETACRLFEKSHRLKVSALRDRCLQVICDPSRALPLAYQLPGPLLGEVMTSKLYDINDYGLAMMFLKWAQNPEALKCGVDGFALLENYINFAALSEEECKEVFSLAQSVESVSKLTDQLEDLRKRSLSIAAKGSYTGNVFETLWERYVDYRTELQRLPGERRLMHTPFLGYWVNLIPSRASFEMPYSNAWNYREASHRVDLWEDDELLWMLPHHVVHVSGLSFESHLQLTSRVQVFCSADGNRWELLWDSGTHAQVKATIACRSKQPAKWFKLCVLKGEHRNTLNIQGVLQDLPSSTHNLTAAAI